MNITISLGILVALFFCHYVGDFRIQNDKMATNKSSSNKWLTIHVVTYMIPFFIFYTFYFLFESESMTFTTVLGVLGLNFVLHWVTDYITSRIATHFHKKGNRGLFFETIGFDQFIHMVSLVSVHAYMVG